MTTINLYGGPKKLDLIQMAFEQAGQSDFNYQLTPEEYRSALRILNSMMAEWETSEGIALNYFYPPYGDGAPEEESGIPASAAQCVSTALAFRINPTIGKTTTGETKVTLARSMGLLRMARSVPSMTLSARTPRGTGNRWANSSLGGPYFSGTDEG